MRLSEWRKAAPKDGVLDDGVMAVVVPVLVDLGAEPDPECWIAWGEDPEVRYSLLAPTLAGLITLAIRFTTQEEGPRVIAKLVRWSKVTVSELGVESGAGHRIVAVQVESIVLKGMDEEADRICEFVLMLIAGVDNRGPGPIIVAGSMAPMLAAASAATPRVSVRNAPPKVRATAAVAAPSAAPEAKSGPGAGPTPKTSKVVPPAPKGVLKAVKPVAVTSPAPAPAPAPADAVRSADRRTPPTPIAARAAAHLGAAEATPATPATPLAPEDGESEPDRSGWVGPHAIEELPPRKTPKPRAWMP